MTIRALFGFTAAIALSTASLHAQTFNESGDAGQTLATASNTGFFGNPLTAIAGTISSGTDADLYRIFITAPTTFSASTVNGTTMIDTALFLFNSSGAAIYMNDDASGASFQSTLPAGTSFTISLSPGVYFLGISLSGNEPINLNGQLLFEVPPGGDTTAVRGPASGVSPATLSNFNNMPGFAESGAYQITLTSTAAVPEPSTIVLATGGALGLLAWLRRRASV